ncbi:hypothetical protein C8035_v000414 [Colletotrichum spinosum]|uniref:Uncharacterized protein n=1 Tax=Colletotrichum spinosum TaxID=1347390 RepID=A0A4R8PKY0_9PEZI|nr:hypothetical protein C8035_v000414 [Colletotrichum spinosum]
MKRHGRPPPVGIQPEDPKPKVNPGHLQFNGVRSPTSGPSDSAGSVTEVAFTQPGAMEVAFIDEAPPKKAGTSKCYKLSCFPTVSAETAEDDNGAPPSPTVDAPSKILARWRPVYPQKDGPLIKPGEGTNLRDPRLNTWHGDTAQRPSTHRLARQTEFDDVNEEDLPPNGKPSVAHRKDIKPPIPPKAASRYKSSTKPLQHIRVDANSKGLRKVFQQNAFTEDPKPTASASHVTKASLGPAVDSVSGKDIHASRPARKKDPDEPGKAPEAVWKPLRVSVRQPERKAKEKEIRRDGRTQAKHPPIFQSGRMFRDLPGLSLIADTRTRERSEASNENIVSVDDNLPSAGKLSVSNPSSLRIAMEAASKKMEKEDYEQENAGSSSQKETKETPYSCPLDEESVLPPEYDLGPAHDVLQKGETSGPTKKDDHDIDDRDVLRGLSIAMAAACDEEVDAWIRQKTGVRIRRFLADLRAFEALGDEIQPDPQRERARMRRAEIRKLKAQVRQSRTVQEARKVASTRRA